MNAFSLKAGVFASIALVLGLGTLFPLVAQQRSLIPLPQSLHWSEGSFPLDRCQAIIVSDEGLKDEASLWLSAAGREIPVRTAKAAAAFPIRLHLGEVKTPRGQEEAYRLSVGDSAVTITANSAHGIFNALQTLSQLTDSAGRVQACEIMDYPAYRWRGYMVDVGRNYHSMVQLKQQIDVMSRYKLNVFHFHLTEDVAWRLQIKKYPQLTSAESMTRDKGRYYSIEDMKELIRYCRERHITLVPEIDMPGHSAAFRRAMGTSMQSDTGLRIVKDILTEVCNTYDVPYIHIGADEVEIKNERFLPEVSELLQSFGKQVIAWAPGGNYDKHTIRHLWKEEGEGELGQEGVRYIDSKLLYLSDMDPQNVVVSIFQRQLGKQTHGNDKVLGAEICLWDDRRVAEEKDHLEMNAVYPGMLAFGERSWRGGGYPEVAYYIGPDSSERAKDFAAFEKRLIEHKKSYFSELPFPYVKQTQLRWKLFGPFPNAGKLEAAFWPEKDGASLADSAAAIQARGGTIWLWQTYSPQVSAWLPSPKEQTTWYAYARFRSPADTTIAMWIEFKNISRSGADATPPAGQWDYKKSKIWINGKAIPPPRWKYPGRPSGRLEEPLADEGYYYRPPSMVRVQKGWNEILLKLPLDTFNFDDWQRPPKWMFTVIPVQKGKGVNWEASDIEFH